MDSEVFARIRDYLADQLEIDSEKITPESDIVNDFGADSLDVIDMITTLSDEFGVEIPDEDIENFHTVGDVVHHQSGRVTGLANGNAQTDRPEKDADIVALHQRFDGIVNDTVDEVLEHFSDAAGRSNLLCVGNQVHRHGEKEESNNRRRCRRKGAHKVEHQNRSHVCGRA